MIDVWLILTRLYSFFAINILRFNILHKNAWIFAFYI